jgi:hypothetical protein
LAAEEWCLTRSSLWMEWSKWMSCNARQERLEVRSFDHTDDSGLFSSLSFYKRWYFVPI